MGFLKEAFSKKMAGRKEHFQIASVRTLQECRWDHRHLA
jgi:hypothetical protein